MKRSTVLLNVAAVLYLVAWLSPVAEGGTTLAKGGLPGWEALRVALSPIWDRSGGDALWRSALSILSALTNGWFLYTLAALGGRVSASERVLFWGSVAAVVINAQWFVLSDPRSDLFIGYYLWLASFAALAAAAHSARAFAVAPSSATGEPTRA